MVIVTGPGQHEQKGEVRENMTFSIEQSLRGTDLVLTGDWSSAAQDVFLDGRADGLILNYARGFREQPIDFIQGLPIRKLNLLARSVSDLTPIYSLAATLQELLVQSDPRAVIDLEELPNLNTLAASWPQIRGSVKFASHIADLSVASFSERDLEDLSSLSSLTSLSMKERPRLHSLDGVEAFPWLAHLGVYWARPLKDITALQRAASPILQSLQLPMCKNVTDVSPVSYCPSLQFFELSEGAEIPTVAPLSSLKGLETLYLYGSTKVADGDLRPIAGLPRLNDFRMMNRNNYKPSVRDIAAAIKLRS